MKKAPIFLKKYFWDINFDELNVELYPKHILERILEYGDERAIKWMMKKFSRAQIIGVLQKSRELTPKSGNFWAFILNAKKEEIRCLNMSFREIRKQFWPY